MLDNMGDELTLVAEEAIDFGVYYRIGSELFQSFDVLRNSVSVTFSEDV